MGNTVVKHIAVVMLFCVFYAGNASAAAVDDKQDAAINEMNKTITRLNLEMSAMKTRVDVLKQMVEKKEEAAPNTAPAAAVPADEGFNPVVSASLDYAGMYEDQRILRPVLQPGLGIEYEGFGLALWANYDINGIGQFTEIDWSFEYSREFGEFGVKAGYAYKICPDLVGLDETTDGTFDDYCGGKAQEYSVAAEYRAPVTAGLGYAYTVEDMEHAVELSGSYEQEIRGITFGLNLAVEYLSDPEHSGISKATAEISGAMELTEWSGITVKAVKIFAIDRAAAEDFLFFGASLGVELN